jgi:hypothetical protein
VHQLFGLIAGQVKPIVLVPLTTPTAAEYTQLQLGSEAVCGQGEHQTRTLTYIRSSKDVFIPPSVVLNVTIITDYLKHLSAVAPPEFHYWALRKTAGLAGSSDAVRGHHRCRALRGAD